MFMNREGNGVLLGREILSVVLFVVVGYIGKFSWIVGFHRKLFSYYGNL